MADDCLGQAVETNVNARVSAERVRALRAGLSDRDLALLHDLDRLRVLSAQQVQRLHFTSGSPLTMARRCRRQLRRLSEHGVLHRYERTIGGVRAGSSGFIYALTPQGHRLVSGSDGQRRRRPAEPSAPFMRHRLAISELYVQLHEGERVGRFELTSFEAEPACWRTSRDGLRTSLLKPDAFVQLSTSVFEELAFVEVDLGSESRSVLTRKADAYQAYWQTGREQHQRGVFPRVVFLTNDAKRADVLARLLGSHDASRLFRVGRLERAPAVLLGEDEPPTSNEHV